MLTGTYAVGPSRTTLTVRYLGPGKVTNYPMTSQQGLADDVNHVDSTWYFDLSENYDLSIAGAKVTLFGVVENLFDRTPERSEEHTSELQSLMRISYAVFCLKKNNHKKAKKN